MSGNGASEAFYDGKEYNESRSGGTQSRIEQPWLSTPGGNSSISYTQEGNAWFTQNALIDTLKSFSIDGFDGNQSPSSFNERESGWSNFLFKVQNSKEFGQASLLEASHLPRHSSKSSPYSSLSCDAEDETGQSLYALSSIPRQFFASHGGMQSASFEPSFQQVNDAAVPPYSFPLNNNLVWNKQQDSGLSLRQSNTVANDSSDPQLISNSVIPISPASALPMDGVGACSQVLPGAFENFSDNIASHGTNNPLTLYEEWGRGKTWGTTGTAAPLTPTTNQRSSSAVQALVIKARDVLDRVLWDLENMGVSRPVPLLPQILKSVINMFVPHPEQRDSNGSSSMRGVGGRNFSAPTMLAHPDDFKNPSSYLKIYGDPLCEQNNGSDVSCPLKNQSGNWACRVCHNVNFPRRFRCNICHSERDALGDEVVAEYTKMVYNHHLKMYKAMESNPGVAANHSRHSSVAAKGNSNFPNNIAGPSGRKHYKQSSVKGRGSKVSAGFH